MSVTHNGVAVKSMTYNGVTVNSWVHNGVEVYSAASQLKYVVTFKANDNSGAWPGNIKIYSVKNGSLLKNVDFSVTTATPYNDGKISIVWGSLAQYRWTFTAIVAGTISSTGSYNMGNEYSGGTNKQVVPYVQNAQCVVTFTTTGNYKV